MSLINDALKKASGKPAAPVDIPTAAPIMHAAEEQKGTPRAWILAGAAVLLVVIAVLIFRKSPESAQAKATPEQATPLPAVANPVDRAAAVLEKAAERNQEGQQLAASITGTKPDAPTATTAVSPPQPVASKPAEPAVPEFPEVRLQAIYYRMNFPTAVLNGKTLAPGEEIEGAKLVAIHRNSVEVEFLGKKKILEMK